jgi:hypothetical protein
MAYSRDTPRSGDSATPGMIVLRRRREPSDRTSSPDVGVLGPNGRLIPLQTHKRPGVRSQNRPVRDVGHARLPFAPTLGAV